MALAPRAPRHFIWRSISILALCREAAIKPAAQKVHNAE
jgi:hypothetical protein